MDVTGFVPDFDNRFPGNVNQNVLLEMPVATHRPKTALVPYILHQQLFSGYTTQMSSSPVNEFRKVL
jgi:hypothetical protein